MADMAPLAGRKYKSRKQRPCDACRKRKTCCVRDPGYDTCTLCRMRSKKCQFESVPKARPGRRSKAYCTPPGDSTAATQQSSPSQADAGDASKEWIPQFVGLSGDQDPFVLRHCAFNDLNYFKRPDWACLRVDGRRGNATHFVIMPQSHLGGRPPYYPHINMDDVVRSDGPQLIKAYFRAVHSSLPLLDPAMLRLDSKPDRVLLASIYFHGAPFCTQKSIADPYLQLHTFIRQALPLESQHPKLETVEAALLFLQRRAKFHRAPTTPGLWSEVGSLVGMSQELGLNVDPTTWDLPLPDRNRRIRLWWMVYIQDKWAAFGLGRSSYLHDDDFDVPLPAIENFPWENYGGLPPPKSGILQFIAMAHLTCILSDILKTFYSLKAIERLKHCSREAITNQMRGFQQRLQAFHDDHLINLYTIDTFLDPTGTIFLAYYTVQIALYRAILRDFDPNDVNYSLLRSNSKLVLHEVTSLLQTLTLSRLQAFWWCQMSNINFATAGGFMMSMLLTSVDDEEVEYWSTQMKLYQDLLEGQSAHFDTTKLAAARMTLLNGIGRSVEGGESSFSEAGNWRTIFRDGCYTTSDYCCDDYRDD